MVIVGIPTFGNKGLNEVMNTRFGRCNTFTFITIENNEIVEVKSVANDAQGAMGGAGIQAAQIIPFFTERSKRTRRSGGTRH